MNKLALLFLLTTATGCFGQLLIDEASTHATCTTSADCGLGQVCSVADGKCSASPGACSPTVTNGDCARGEICDGGVCVCVNSELCNCAGSVCLTGWCNCQPGQGCDDGVCVTIVGSGPTANSCAAERPSGVCADGVDCCSGICCGVATDVCVGNFCVPNDRPCSASEPNGWCGQGLGCNAGRCEPLDQCACSSSRKSGCCPDGQTCDNGTCTAHTCTDTTPGSCPSGQVCTTTGCQSIACSAGHIGTCPSGYCSVTGSCLPSGTCGARGDCSNTQYCASNSQCRTLDTCAVDADCTIQLGQGYACSAGACVERTSCTTAADCATGKYCSAQQHCLAKPACDLAADCAGTEFCSANKTCVTQGCCAVDVDCGWPSPQSICVERGTCDVCVPYLSCDAAHTGDCPPGYACNTGNNTCELTGATCDTNDFTTACGVGASVPLTCCAVAGPNHCCAAGQHCSTGINRCISMGKCLANSDCAAGFVCSDFACVPGPAIGCPCPVGQHCATVRDAFNNAVDGCIADTNCAGLGDCPGGFRCNAEYQCELDPQCGNQELTVGSIVPPNVLITFDRSRSMQLCGPGDSTFGDCGFNLSGNACNDSNLSTTCMGRGGVGAQCTSAADCNGGASTPLECTTAFIDANEGNLTSAQVCNDQQCTAGCAPFGPFNSDGTCVTPFTTPRWNDALTAIKGDNGSTGVLGLIDTYLTRVSFGLSIFPHPPGGETCTQACRYTSCNDTASAAGALDVAIGFGTATHDAIETALNATVPGGATPTAATLRAILGLASPLRSGLAAPDRANAVLLVTDGAPTFDTSTVKTCEPPCSDGIKNGGETAVDCGGLCGPCADSKGCLTDDDCSSLLCRASACRPITCANDSKDGDETDVDCGGSCQPCAENLACIVDGDCASLVCTGTTCTPPQCNDGLKNGFETGVDCGGNCGATCADGVGCVDNTNCTSGFCDTVTALCRPAHCNNGATDGGETGLNCGGGGCATCATQCTDGVKNGAETDIDCGGGTCPKCPGAHSCESVAFGSRDCLSGTCTVCAADALPAVNVAAQSCRVNAAIDRLYDANPRIKTFVVGFNIAGNSTLNCNAVYGKTARHDVVGCDALTRATCGNNGAPTCYYNASDPAALQTAFDTVIQQVSSCSFALTGIPPDPFGLSVYLQSSINSDDRLPIFGGSNWRYDFITNRIEFFGTSCTQIKSGSRIPIVIYGCLGPGG